MLTGIKMTMTGLHPRLTVLAPGGLGQPDLCHKVLDCSDSCGVELASFG